MLENLKRETNTAFTENGAVTPATTGSDCLDFFATAGGLRKESDAEIVTRFTRAFSENPDIAMKILFYTRDVRGGLGERRVFRVILEWLARNHSGSVSRNVRYIAEYGRFDDLLVLLDTPCRNDAIRVISEQLRADLAGLENGGEVSLLAKWLPSVNASNKETVKRARLIARHLGMSEPQYRRTLVRLRAHIRIIENNLRCRDYTFDYSKQPSKASFKYRKAFLRNDFDRYTAFLNAVNDGTATMNTSSLYPYELVEPYLSLAGFWEGNCYMRSISEEEKAVLNTTWAALPDYTRGENALAVVDTSGSMYTCYSPSPASVALSLGVYFAERNKGLFHNHFIEFSERPQLIELKGETFADRFSYIAGFNEVANTDIEAVFDLILRAAVKNNVPQEELPATLYIISDMEFDCCVENSELSNFENARKRFEDAGYALPRVVFWNVASRNRHQPVSMNEQGVALVSGCSPRIFSMLSVGDFSPMSCMMSIIGSERYAPITA